mmetsp:Transcript_88947/g.272432  ORF Transcript_88947/g.272432 Transcript_88947/m.272432 type:complete len:303 (-) Transcript_88947:118-1026(-)
MLGRLPDMMSEHDVVDCLNPALHVVRDTEKLCDVARLPQLSTQHHLFDDAPDVVSLAGRDENLPQHRDHRRGDHHAGPDCLAMCINLCRIVLLHNVVAVGHVREALRPIVQAHNRILEDLELQRLSLRHDSEPARLDVDRLDRVGANSMHWEAVPGVQDAENVSAQLAIDGFLLAGDIQPKHAVLAQTPLLHLPLRLLGLLGQNLHTAAIVRQLVEKRTPRLDVLLFHPDDGLRFRRGQHERPLRRIVRATLNVLRVQDDFGRSALLLFHLAFVNVESLGRANGPHCDLVHAHPSADRAIRG